MLGEKDDTICSLQEQLTHVKKFENKEFTLDTKEFDLKTKEELLWQKEEFNPLARGEQEEGLKAELDALAREETSLNNLLFSITDALSTVQVRTYLSSEVS